MRLTKETRSEIEQMRRQTRDKKQHIRLSVLIMLDEGFTHEVIAVSLGIDADTVGNYKQKYLQKGLQAYLKDNYVAYQGKLTQQQLGQVNQKVEQGLYQTAREVGDYIFGAFGVDYSDSVEDNSGKKLVLICDNAPYYHSRLLQEWLAGQPLIKQWSIPFSKYASIISF